jgi:hypothetical protein
MKGIWIVADHPVDQGRTDVEADMLKVAQLDIRAVTFSMDAFVPISIGRSAKFRRDGPAQGILSRRLVKMSVDAKCT